MIARLVTWSADNRLVVFFVSAILAVSGALAATRAPLDAIPDLSDTQVIVATEWMGKSPDLVEDQVTWPLSSRLLGAAGVSVVRGQSMFGMSFVYAIFEDGTPPAVARQRVTDALAGARGSLPAGVEPRLGPDASGVGWVYQYALVDDSGALGPAELRTLQDTVIRPVLQGSEGVAEIASVGGYTRQVEVSVDPARLVAHGISFGQVADAVAAANTLGGGGSIEVAGHELMVRSRSEARSLDDLRDAVIVAGSMEAPSSPAMRGVAAPAMDDGMSAGMTGSTPVPAAARSAPSQPPHRVRVRDVADVQWVPAARRGVADLDGRGETPGGIVVARQGQNALAVIDAAKARIEAISPALPPGVRVVPVYDRSELIRGAIGTLTEALSEELIAVGLVIVIFLGHFRTALVPIIVLPTAVLATFVPLYFQGVTVNVMSLAGIVVAVGAMVDASILCVENVHAALARWEAEGRPGNRRDVLVEAMREVGPSAFFSLLVIGVAFVPVFALEASEGRLFSPLAWTKTWAMLFASVLGVTLAPALAVTVIRGRARTEEEDRLSGFLSRLYEPVVRRIVRWRAAVLALAGVALAATVPVLLQLEWEFMPPLREGTLLYMPTAPPGISEAEAARVLAAMDAEVRAVPEVASVYGKMGRADSATDPAPLSMAEAVIQLRPESEWRPGLTWEGLIAELDARVQVPGMPNAWWMPVQTRTEMLSTGIRSPLGIKIQGPSADAVEAAAIQLEGVLAAIPGTRSLYADRTRGGFYLDVDVRREIASALGITAGDVVSTVERAIGGQRVGDWYDGRLRVPVMVRYAKDFRTDPGALGAAWIDRVGDTPVALGTVAELRPTSGPDMIRSEDAGLVGFLFVDPGERSLDGWVRDAETRISEAGLGAPGALGSGVRWSWAGTFQALDRALGRLAIMIPVTLVAITALIRLNTRSWTATAIIVGLFPFSIIGAAWFLWALGYKLSVAVIVGMIAMAGLDAETSVVMLLYLRLAWEHRGGAAGIQGAADLEEVIVEGAARRLRPKLMTVLTDLVGFVPVFLVGGIGSDVMRRISAPMVGGLVGSLLVELLVFPALFAAWKAREVRAGGRRL